MNLEELERLAREATPGPWEANEDGVATRVNGRYRVVLSSNMYDIRRARDSAFIAACSPETVLRLVSIARAAEAYVDIQTPYLAKTTDDAVRHMKEIIEAAAALRAALIPPGCKPT